MATNEGGIIIDTEERECCIYKVPKNLRKVNDEAYTPQLISIGPYYYRQKEFADMIKHKRRLYKAFYERIKHNKRKELISFIRKNEKKIRRQYSEPCWLKSDEFVMMILFDAIFIIEIFLRKYLRDTNDILIEKIWLGAIRPDLQLLENQLPYFVLEELYKIAFLSTPCPSCGTSIAASSTYGASVKEDESLFPSFRYLSCVFFGLHLSHNIPPYEESIKVKHFTDLCRQALVETQSKRKFRTINNVKELTNAVKLRKSGVKFKGLLDSKNYLVEINVEKRKRGISCSNKVDQQQIPRRSFSNEVVQQTPRRSFFNKVVQQFPRISFFNQVELQIPRIYVDDGTESLIRNVMALEQCLYPSDTYICGYIELMDSLIENEEDVDYLVKKGVISNHVGSNAVVVEMFNKFGRQIPSSISYYSHICKDLRDHYGNPWNHTKTTLKSTYFNNPWRGTATIAASIILVLTLTQTVFSTYSVFH